MSCLYTSGQIPHYLLEQFNPIYCFLFPATEEQWKQRIDFIMVPGDWEQCIKPLSHQQYFCTLGHKGKDQADCKFKELLILKLTWENSKDPQNTNLKLLARLVSMWSRDSYLKFFLGLYPSLFWYKMLRRQDLQWKIFSSIVLFFRWWLGKHAQVRDFSLEKLYW